MAAARNVAKVAKMAEPVVSGGLSTQWATGKKYQLPQVNKASSEAMKRLSLFAYKEDEYCKVGMLKHDLINPEDFWLAEEAIRRMTEEQQQGFYWRLNRAILLSSRKRNLPKEEWTPMDAPHLYLEDIINQIQREQMEKNLTKCALNDYDDNWERLMLIPFRMYHYFTIRNLRKSLAEKYGASVV